MRLAWLSDDPAWSTGFGCESHEILSRLKKARSNWELGAFCPGYLGQPLMTMQGYMRLPAPFAAEQDNAAWYIRQMKPDVVVTLRDLFYSAYMAGLSRRSGFSTARWVNWFVYDEDCRDLGFWLPVFNNCDKLVAISKYSQNGIKNNFGVECTRIPHGVDRAHWQPPAKDLLERTRMSFGNPNFVFGAFFRNIWRKEPVLLLEAWNNVRRDYPDAILLANWVLRDEMGYDLMPYLQHFDFGKSLIIAQSPTAGVGIPRNELNLYYHLSDVQVLPTRGEGFGKPILEGYAAKGLPVIMTNCTSYSELVGDHGLPIQPIGTIWTRNMGKQTLPSRESLEQTMRIMLDDKGLRQKFMEYNVRFVEGYDYDRCIIPLWLELLEGLIHAS